MAGAKVDFDTHTHTQRTPHAAKRGNAMQAPGIGRSHQRLEATHEARLPYDRADGLAVHVDARRASHLRCP